MSNKSIGTQCQGLDDPRFRTTLSQQMAASCTGALITAFAMTPFDVVKIRLQTQNTLNTNKCFLYCNGLMDHLCPCVNSNGEPVPTSASQMSRYWYQRHGHFTGTIDAFMKISRNEGMVSLWSGLGPTLVLAVPATMVYFTSYENLRLMIQDRYNGCQPTWGPLVAGSTARTWAVTLVSPLELVRTKMQSKRLTYKEMAEALKTLVHYHGFRGLFKGLSSTLLRDVPFSGIYWLHYEYIKRKYSTGVPSFKFSFLAGAISGAIAAIITIPFDVVKTHQQIELGEKEIYKGKRLKMEVEARPHLAWRTSEPPQKGSTMRVVMTRIYGERGLRGFYAGLTPRLVKVVPACAIMISTFEYGKYFFHRYSQSG